MSRPAFLVILAAVQLGAAAPVRAGDDGYCARLSARDHVNSAGRRLASVGAIVQQDRANFHARGLRDAQDQDDPHFHDPVSRAALGRRIDESGVSAADARAILTGAPMVCVGVQGDTATIISVR